jgi:hypothetical protein
VFSIKIAWLYGPMGAGALADLITLFIFFN